MPIDLSRDKENEIFFRHIEYVRNPQIAVGKIKKQNTTEETCIMYWKSIDLVDININVGNFNKKFVSHWRYSLLILIIMQENWWFRKICKRMRSNEGFIISSYFLHLKDDIFDQLEITLSPNISEESRKLVDNLVQQYAPKAIIKESTFHNKVIFKWSRYRIV